MTEHCDHNEYHKADIKRYTEFEIHRHRREAKRRCGNEMITADAIAQHEWIDVEIRGESVETPVFEKQAPAIDGRDVQHHAHQPQAMILVMGIQLQ